MNNDLGVSVRMEQSTNDGSDGDDGSDEVQRGTVTFTVSDRSNDQSLSGVTIRVASNDESYDREKQTGMIGRAVFDNVPVTPCTFTLEKTDYDTITIEVNAEQFGGEDVTRGYN